MGLQAVVKRHIIIWDEPFFSGFQGACFPPGISSIIQNFNVVSFLKCKITFVTGDKVKQRNINISTKRHDIWLWGCTVDKINKESVNSNLLYCKMVLQNTKQRLLAFYPPRQYLIGKKRSA